MDRPDAAQVREWATGNDGAPIFDFTRYGLAPPTGDGADRLQRTVDAAIGYVEGITGRTLDSTLTDPGLVALAQDATLMRVEQVLVSRGTQRAVRDALGSSERSSMRAGDYAETRRAPGDVRKGFLLNPWRELSDTLWALATPEKADELRAELNGTVRPAVFSSGPDVFVYDAEF
jgi:hypothetical protein